MEEKSLLKSEKLEKKKNTQEMLRGYDPLSEAARWSLMIICFCTELSIMSILIMQISTNNWADPSSTSTSFYGILVVSVVVLLICIGLPFFLLQNHRKSQRQRKNLRQAALRTVLVDEPCELSILPSPSATEHFSLPVFIKSRIQRRSLMMVSLGATLTCLLLVLGWIITANVLILPVWFALFADIALLAVFFPGAWVANSLLYQTASYYLLPSFRVTDDDVSARYGRTTITILWKDIRHLALINGVIGISNNKMFDGNYKCNEVFEISDGENSICWQAASSLRSYNLRLAGEVTWLPQDYNAFTQQLAALIVERTRLPLYDFRAPERKAKRSKQKEQA